MKVSVLLTCLLYPLVHGFVPHQPTTFAPATRTTRSSVHLPTANVDATPARNVRLDATPNDIASDEQEGEFSWGPIRIGAVGAYLALIVFVLTSPGQLADPADNALIEQIVADPVNPGINPIYYTIFNLFTVMPVILAAMTLPQASKKGVPPTPFLLGSVFLGFFTYGPYLIFRKDPATTVSQSDLGWFTSILENRLFGVFTILLTFLVVLAPDAYSAYQADPVGTWQGFVDLMSTSKFCSVSAFDISMLYVFIVSLTPGDYKLRNPNASDSDALKVAALSALVPYLGSAIYMTLRPRLPE